MHCGYEVVVVGGGCGRREGRLGDPESQMLLAVVSERAKDGDKCKLQET